LRGAAVIHAKPRKEMLRYAHELHSRLLLASRLRVKKTERNTRVGAEKKRPALLRAVKVLHLILFVLL
jgi:hypothetical protein